MSNGRILIASTSSVKELIRLISTYHGMHIHSCSFILFCSFMIAYPLWESYFLYKMASSDMDAFDDLWLFVLSPFYKKNLY